MDIISLQDRAILEIKGQDRKQFLQGLITNDINKASENNLIYSAMLSPQGRFLYDFFIFEKNNSLFLDCLKSRRDEIFTKFRFYKLRSQVEIIKNDELKIFWCEEKSQSPEALCFKDVRHSNLGFRIYCNNDISNNKDETKYNYKRISLKIPESENDLTQDKSIIAEFNFDNLNAIDYQKGCYIGQELTARTHYMGEIRKKIFHIKIPSLQKIDKNSEISCEGKNVGIVLSSVFINNELHALALIKIAEDQNSQNCSTQNCQIITID